MTSNRSNDGSWLFEALIGAALCGFFLWASETVFETVWIVGVFAFIFYRNHIRRRTLRQREDGLYVWVEWHGAERSSWDDPSEPGGAWDSDGDGDGGD